MNGDPQEGRVEQVVCGKVQDWSARIMFKSGAQGDQAARCYRFQGRRQETGRRLFAREGAVQAGAIAHVGR